MNTNTFAKLNEKFAKFLQGESGATAVEYAIMLALIIGVAFAAIQGMGGDVADTMTNNSDQIANAFNQ